MDGRATPCVSGVLMENIGRRVNPEGGVSYRKRIALRAGSERTGEEKEINGNRRKFVIYAGWRTGRRPIISGMDEDPLI